MFWGLLFCNVIYFGVFRYVICLIWEQPTADVVVDVVRERDSSLFLLALRADRTLDRLPIDMRDDILRHRIYDVFSWIVYGAAHFIEYENIENIIIVIGRNLDSLSSHADNP